MTAPAATHARDTDCAVGPDDTCTGCGVHHGDPCPTCGQRGYHLPTCWTAPREPLSAADMANRVATAMKVAGNLTREHVEYDTAEGYFLDHVCAGASEEQVDALMAHLDSAYGR